MIEDFLAETKIIRAAATYRTYSQVLARWARAFPAGDSLAALEFVKSQGIKSRRTVAGVLVAYFKWLVINDSLPGFNLEKFRYQMGQTAGKYKPQLHSRLPTSAQVQRLRASWRGDYRNLAIVEVLISTGCRADELCRLDRANLLFDNRLWVLGKGGKERYLYLSSRAVTALNRYLLRRRDSDPALFLLGGRGHGRLSYAALVNVCKPLTPHQLRHYFATELLRSCNDISIVQAALGHSSPTTTAVYAKLADERVQVAHKRAFG